MNNFMNPQQIQALKTIEKENDRTLKQLFRDKINGSFLIKIKNQVLTELGAEFFNIFSLSFDYSQIVTGNNQTPEYDICRIITGVHSHHSIFLTKEEIRNTQNDPTYQRMLVNEVVEKIRLYPLNNKFFRKEQLLIGDEYIFFPVPYQLFTLCMRFHSLLRQYQTPILTYYIDIINNALSVLTLMENNLLSNAYPLCRGMIEQYIKTLILQKHPESIETYSKFCEFEIEQSCCSQKYSDDFNALYNKRIYHSAKKIEYLHYGWLDCISTYKTRTNHYSIYGILEYLQNDANTELSLVLNHLTKLYKGCHGYTHGSSMHVKYPLLQYFELSIMLYYVVKDIFISLYNELNIEMFIDDITLIQNLERDFELLQKQYHMRSTEYFELYYSK